MKDITVFSPPENSDSSGFCILGNNPVSIFLAGTIDNGNSDDWQGDLIRMVKSVELKRPVKIYNPRREEWPSDKNHREIGKQIEWELYHLERADMIVMNILADSKSPISLMELGLFAKEGRLVVFCPESFYRYDNVSTVCKRYGIPLYNTNNITCIANKICNYVGVDIKTEEDLEKMCSERLTK